MPISIIAGHVEVSPSTPQHSFLVTGTQSTHRSHPAPCLHSKDLTGHIFVLISAYHCRGALAKVLDRPLRPQASKGSGATCLPPLSAWVRSTRTSCSNVKKEKKWRKRVIMYLKISQRRQDDFNRHHGFIATVYHRTTILQVASIQRIPCRIAALPERAVMTSPPA